MRINNTIHNPIVTEKSMLQKDADRYHFKVNTKATKGAIKLAVEDLFDVDVLSVRTLIMPGKKRRILKTRKYTKTPKWKKAIVTLKEGQEIKLATENSK